MAARPQATGAAGILSARSAQRREERRRVFDQLFTDHWIRVSRHVECYLAVDAEAHEVVAQVFQLAWERLRPARPGGLTWLLRLADETLREQRRRSGLRGSVLDEVHRNVVTDEREESTLDRRDVLDAMAGLTERERRAIVLTYWDGLSVREVGEVLRSRPGAVRATLTRARVKLRDALEGV